MWNKLNGCTPPVLSFHTGVLNFKDGMYSQGYAQVVNSGWKLKFMYWRSKRFGLLTPDGLIGAICMCIQGVPGGMCQTSGECSLG